MKLAIISGSHRSNSESGRVAKFLENRAQELLGVESDIIDLGKEALPLWDDEFWRGEGECTEKWAPISEKLKAADGVIVIAAEWNGTAPAGLVNFFHYTSGAELGHKPAMLVGVSASKNGVYPVAEMRSYSAKNNKMVYVPDHLIVRNVAKVLRDDVESEFKDEDAYMRERIDYSMKVLEQYMLALKSVRDSGVAETQKFVFGM